MKKLILSAVVITIIFIAEGCGNSGAASSGKDTTTIAGTADTSAKMKDTASSTSAANTDKASADFAMDAAKGGMAEVAMGNIAAQKAMNPRVKNFGAMMVTDHTKANDDLKQRAMSQNIMLPSAISDDDQKMIDKLNKKSGKDFDKTYMDMMLDDHKKDIADFKKAADKCTNASIKDFANSTLPTLQKHLDSAQAIAGKK